MSSEVQDDQESARAGSRLCVDYYSSIASLEGGWMNVPRTSEGYGVVQSKSLLPTGRLTGFDPGIEISENPSADRVLES